MGDMVIQKLYLFTEGAIVVVVASMPVRVSDNIFFLCILLYTGNRKCNWYDGTITVNSELDSASNDIYFLNMQLFPW